MQEMNQVLGERILGNLLSNWVGIDGFKQGNGGQEDTAEVEG